MAISSRQVQNKRDSNGVLTGKPGTVYDVNIKYNSPEGKKTYSKKGFATKKEAAQHEAEMKVKLSNPVYTPVIASQGKQTVKEYLEEWVENHGKANLRPSTFASYKSHIKNHIVPYVGHVQLNQLTPAMLDNMFQQLFDKGLSNSTAIAFFGAYFKVQQLIVMTVNGLIQGCLPVMRFNYGAGNSERLHSAFRYGIALVTGMMILGMLAVILFPAQILGLFTASEAMRSFGISAMRIMATSYLFCGLSTMISTYFQATEKVGSSMAIQLCRQLLFLIPSLWCLDKWFHLNGIWLAFPVAETGTLLVALIMMAWYHRKKIIACSAKEEG